MTLLLSVLAGVLLGATGGAGVGRGAEWGAVVVPDAAQLVGQVAGSELYLGVVAEQRRAVAFVSDGKRVGVWMAGSVRDQQATLRDSSGGSLTLQLKSGAGTLRLTGQAERRVALASATGRAGLYRLDRRSVGPRSTIVETTGWIVLGNGSVRGVQRLDRSGGAVTFGAAGKVPAGARRLTAEALLPSCKPVRLSAPNAPSTEPPGCGLPDGRPAATPRTNYRVTRNPKASGLTQQQLRAALDRAKALTLAEARSRGLRPATAAARRAFEPWVKSVHGNSRIVGAADSLRSALLARNYESVSNRLAAYEAALAAVRLPSTLRVLSESMRQKLPSVATPYNRPRPSAPAVSSIVVPGADFALAAEEEENGAFPLALASAELATSAEYPGTLIVRATAMAAWHSTGVASAVAIGKFKVPAGVREVELELDGFASAEADHTECMAGIADAYASAWIFVRRILATGATEGVGGKGYTDFGAPMPPQLCTPLINLPRLGPPNLIVPGPYYLTFPVPTGGGAYTIKLTVTAEAEVTGVGNADASSVIRMDKITARFHR